MEKDIEILEKFIKIKINSYAMQFVDIPYPRLQEAIANLINRVKELEVENQELKLILYEIRNKLKGKIIIEENACLCPRKNLTKQEVYKTFLEISKLLRSNYLFIDNEIAIQLLLEEEK